MNSRISIVISVVLLIAILITGGTLWWLWYGDSQHVRDAKMQALLQDQNKQLEEEVSSSMATTTDQFTGEEGVSTTTMDMASSTIVSSATPKLPQVKDMQVDFGILMYHYIGDTDPKMSKSAASLHVTTENLDSQIKYLLDKGYHFVTLNEAYDMFTKNGKTPPKTLVLTFDDGYRSFYTNAFPILKKYNVKASAYIISQDIGHKGNVTWDMMKELVQSGLVEIGSHTVNHKDLKKLSDDEQRFQMGQNKKDLEQGLGITVNTIVYPYGEYNTTTKRLAKELGFKGGAAVYNGVRPSTKDYYNWRRVQIENNDVGDELLRTLYIAFEFAK